SLTLASVKACEMATRQHGPDNAVAIDIHPAWTVSLRQGLGVLPRHFVNFGQSGVRWIRSRVQPNHLTGKHSNRAPHRTIDQAPSNAVEARLQLFVLRGIDGVFRAHIIISLAVAVSVEDECRPTL